MPGQELPWYTMMVVEKLTHWIKWIWQKNQRIFYFNFNYKKNVSWIFSSKKSSKFKKPRNLKSVEILCIFHIIIYHHNSVQSLSHVWLFATPWTAAHQASLFIINSWSLLKLVSIESVMPSNHFILCCPLRLLPSIFPSIRVFPNESVPYIRWPKYWSFSCSTNPSKEYSGLISFRMDWLDLLGIQGTFKSLLQHHSSKAAILQYSAFFTVQLTSIHDYWKNFD